MRIILITTIWLSALVTLTKSEILYDWYRIILENSDSYRHKWQPTSFDLSEDKIYLTFVNKDKETPGIGAVAWFQPGDVRNPILNIFGKEEDYAFFSDGGKIMAPFLVRVDPCGDLWVMDANMYNITGVQRKERPVFHVFDKASADQPAVRHFQDNQWDENSLFINLVFQLQKDDPPAEGQSCGPLIAYIADYNSFHLLLYHYHGNTAVAYTHPPFEPDPFLDVPDQFLPEENQLKINGIHGLALVEMEKYGTLIFFHPLGSTKEYVIPMKYLTSESSLKFEDIRLSYDKGPNSEASKSAYDPMTRTLFFAELSTRQIGCINVLTILEKNAAVPSYGRYDFNITDGIIADIKVVQQHIWVMSHHHARVTIRRERISDVIREAQCTFALRPIKLVSSAPHIGRTRNVLLSSIISFFVLLLQPMATVKP